MIWRNTKESPFRTDGFAFFEKDGIYRRMPVNPEIKLPEAVDGLSNETAGGQIRFHGILKHLEVRVRLSDKPLFFDNIKAPHLSDVSKQSLDLYLSKDGREFIFYDVSKNMSGEKEYTRILIDFEKSEEYDFLLNFPTYGAVDEVLIGTDDDAVISENIHKYDSDKKIVIYGSSIQQGAMLQWNPAAPGEEIIYNSLTDSGHCAELKFGVRRLTAGKTKIRLNGNAYYLRGACEHGYFPETVHPTHDKKFYVRVIKTLKKLGFNYIRFHTYIPAEEYLQAADELGILVQVECPNNTTLDE